MPLFIIAYKFILNLTFHISGKYHGLTMLFILSKIPSVEGNTYFKLTCFGGTVEQLWFSEPSTEWEHVNYKLKLKSVNAHLLCRWHLVDFRGKKKPLQTEWISDNVCVRVWVLKPSVRTLLLYDICCQGAALYKCTQLKLALKVILVMHQNTHSHANELTHLGILAFFISLYSVMKGSGRWV